VRLANAGACGVSPPDAMDSVPQSTLYSRGTTYATQARGRHPRELQGSRFTQSAPPEPSKRLRYGRHVALPERSSSSAWPSTSSST
jgi:hypothetical protein